MVAVIPEGVLKRVDASDRPIVQKATDLVIGNSKEVSIRVKKLKNRNSYLISYSGTIELNLIELVDSFCRSAVRIEDMSLYYRDGVIHLGLVIPKHGSNEATESSVSADPMYGNDCKKIAETDAANLLSDKDHRFSWFVELLHVLYFSNSQTIDSPKQMIDRNSIEFLRLFISAQMCADIDHSFDLMAVYAALYRLKSKYSDILAVMRMSTTSNQDPYIEIGFLGSAPVYNKLNVVDSIVEAHQLDRPLNSFGGLDRFSQGRCISLGNSVRHGNSILSSSSVMPSVSVTHHIHPAHTHQPPSLHYSQTEAIHSTGRRLGDSSRSAIHSVGRVDACSVTSSFPRGMRSSVASGGHSQGGIKKQEKTKKKSYLRSLFEKLIGNYDD